MEILVLDTIHGGALIAAGFRERGHAVTAVDVYRGTPEEWRRAAEGRYDLVVAPVHLDPSHPLLAGVRGPVITHHEAVRRLIRHIPSPMIEVTGARGKTTTASAIASILPGRGVLATSAGTIALPEGDVIGKWSITPASLIPAAAEACRRGGWLVGEVSLGVTGAGDLAVITSAEDYRCAGGKRSALAEKIRSASRSPRVLVAEGVPVDFPDVIRIGDNVRCTGTRCEYFYNGIEGGFENPLLLLSGYRGPLMLAAAAGCLLGIDPSPLAGFGALPGRFAVLRDDGKCIVDASNSGTCRAVAEEAAAYARTISGRDEVILVIGQDGRAVCEGFPDDEVMEVVRAVRPTRVILVGTGLSGDEPAFSGIPAARVSTLNEGRHEAHRVPGEENIVLAVKSWR
jgi:hypothetical protein